MHHYHINIINSIYHYNIQPQKLMKLPLKKILLMIKEKQKRQKK